MQEDAIKKSSSSYDALVGSKILLSEVQKIMDDSSADEAESKPKANRRSRVQAAPKKQPRLFCSIADCTFKGSFNNAADLRQHLQYAHGQREERHTSPPYVDSPPRDDLDADKINYLRTIPGPYPTPTASSKRKGLKCSVPGCRSKGEFIRRSDLRRHYITVHAPKRIDCEYRWCGRHGENGFTRQDHLREHLREVHQQSLPKTPSKKHLQQGNEDTMADDSR